MAGAVRRVTVVGSRRRLDLAVPASAAVAELLPEVVALAGEPVDGAALPRWVLGRLDGEDLPPGASLDSAAVPDGAVLYLRRVDEPVVGLQGVDLVERMSTGGATGFPPAGDRIVLSSAAATLLVVVGALLLRRSSPVAAGSAAALALLALAGGARLASSRLDGNRPAGATLALAAGPLLGLGAWIFAGQASLPGGSTGRWAVGLAGAALGALLAAGAVRGARPPGTALAALLAAAGLGVLLSVPLTASQAASVVAVAALLAVPSLPRVVLRACGLRLSDADRAGQASGRQIDNARAALPWASAAVGGSVVASCAVLARGPQASEVALGALCGLLLILRSRQRQGAAEVLPLAVSGHLAVTAVGIGLAWSHARAAGPLLLLVAVAAVYAVAAAVPSSAVDRPRWAQRRRLLEAVALVAVVPLLAAVLGLFGLVVDLARGVE